MISTDPFLDLFREFPEFSGSGRLKDDLVGHGGLQAEFFLQFCPGNPPFFL